VGTADCYLYLHVCICAYTLYCICTLQGTCAEWETEASLLREQIDQLSSKGGQEAASLGTALEAKRREAEVS
jgi:hypothetical protein